jgi:hypothetical protein
LNESSAYRKDLPKVVDVDSDEASTIVSALASLPEFQSIAVSGDVTLLPPLPADPSYFEKAFSVNPSGFDPTQQLRCTDSFVETVQAAIIKTGLSAANAQIWIDLINARAPNERKIPAAKYLGSSASRIKKLPPAWSCAGYKDREFKFSIDVWSLWPLARDWIPPEARLPQLWKCRDPIGSAVDILSSPSLQEHACFGPPTDDLVQAGDFLASPLAQAQRRQVKQLVPFHCYVSVFRMRNRCF